MPVPGVGYPRLTAPFATSPGSCPPGFVRLACLIHAANVRSEPGSNPSKVIRFHAAKITRHEWRAIWPRDERLAFAIASSDGGYTAGKW